VHQLTPHPYSGTDSRPGAGATVFGQMPMRTVFRLFLGPLGEDPGDGLSEDAQVLSRVERVESADSSHTNISKKPGNILTRAQTVVPYVDDGLYESGKTVLCRCILL